MPVAIIYIAAIMLIVGAAPLPYGYYMVLRVVAAGVFAWAAYTANRREDESLTWTFGLLAVLFNPLIPIHLPKEAWIVVDLAAGILLISTRRKICVR